MKPFRILYLAVAVILSLTSFNHAFATTTIENKTAEIFTWKILRVVDGDTLEVDITKSIKIVDGISIEVTSPYVLPENLKLFVRVSGVDTPEKGGRAKCIEENILATKASSLTKHLVDKAKVITFSNIKWDKFGGRVLAKVEIDNEDLSASLINAGVAKAYFGNKKSSWCNVAKTVVVNSIIVD